MKEKLGDVWSRRTNPGVQAHKEAPGEVEGRAFRYGYKLLYPNTRYSFSLGLELARKFYG